MKRTGYATLAGSLLLMLTAMIWGFAFAVQRAADEALGPFSVTCLRSVAAFLFLLTVTAVFDRVRGGRCLLIRRGRLYVPDITPTEWCGGVLCGLALGCASLLQQAGLGSNDSSGKTAFITSLYVVLVPVLGLLLGKRTPVLVFCGVCGALVGAYFLAVPQGSGFALAPGDTLVLLCALVFAMHILIIDRYSPRCDGLRMSTVQFLTAAVVSAPFMLILERPTLSSVGAGFLPLLYLGILSSGVGYTLQILAQRRTPPAVASVIMSLESVFGVVGGALLYGERMSEREYIGCGILLVSVILTELSGTLLGKKHATDTAAVPGSGTEEKESEAEQ